jgi:hypothetical protein
MGGEKKGELWEGKEGLWMMKRGSVKGGNKGLFPPLTLPLFIIHNPPFPSHNSPFFSPPMITLPIFSMRGWLRVGEKVGG